MIGTILYLFRELITSLDNKAFTLSLTCMAIIFISLSLLAFYNLLGSNPNYVRKTEVLAVLTKGIGEGEINKTYQVIREWDQVSRITFVFKEEANKDLKAPLEEVNSDYFRVVINDSGQMSEVIQKLKETAGIRKVITYKEGFINKVLTLNVQMRIGAYLILAFFFGLAIFFLKKLVTKIIRGWEAELEAMYLSGVRKRFTYIPFFMTTSLIGLLGAIMSVAFIYLFHNWGLNHPHQAGDILPAILNSRMVLRLSLRSCLYGILIGIVGGLFSIPAVRNLEWD